MAPSAGWREKWSDRAPTIMGATPAPTRLVMIATTAAAVVAIMTNLVGAGVAPMIVGALSDHFSRQPADGAMTASAHGLQMASITFALVYLWAAVHFALAGRTIRRDMA